MQRFSHKNGFTLLELLVVLALIGIIASLAFAYMQQSKEKGGDAGVQQNLVNARSQAEVYYANQSGSYEGVCTNVSRSIYKMVRAATRAHGITPQVNYADNVAGDWDLEACHDSPSEYAVWVPLSGSSAGTPRGLCIDSHNVTREVTTPLPANQTDCPAS